ncbi:hypothetical protein LCGC14_1935100, partial [marine sediment metagenome]
AGFRAARRGIQAVAETPAVRRGTQLAAGEAGAARVPGEPPRLTPGQEAVPPDFSPLKTDAEGNIVGHTTLYHGTTGDGAKVIMRDGFRPGEEVYLTGSPTEAQRFAGGKGFGEVLQVELRQGAVGSPGGRFSSDDIIGVSSTRRLTPGQEAVPEPRIPEPGPFPEPEGTIPRGAEGRFPGTEPLPDDLAVVQGQAEALGGAFDAGHIGGADKPGEALNRLSVGTQRGVEARSAPLPPRERAALAGAVTDVEFPMRSMAAVEADFGERFQTNIFTWFDDKLGRRSPLNAAVRRAKVKADLYRSVEGERMKNAVGVWIARNKDVLGLKTLGRTRGIATAVNLREGEKVSNRLVQRLDHILAAPEKYDITSAQRSALDEVERMFEQVMRQEQAHGVDVNELLDSYWTRIVTSAPKNETTTGIRTRIGTRPWYTKERAFPTLEAGDAAGLRYADPITAMEARMSAASETIGNQSLVDEVKRLGTLPSEKVPQTVQTRLKAAQTEFQDAAKIARQTGAIADRIRVEEAANALDEAKRAMRVESTKVSQQRPVRFGRLVDADVAEEIDRYIQTIPDNFTDDAFRIIRTLRVNADSGSAGLQNWYTMWRNPVGWMKAFAYGLQSVAKEPHDFLLRNADVIDEGARFGAIRVPTEMLLSEGGTLSQRVSRLPVIRESQRIFEWNIFIAQVERWKGVRRALLNPDGTFDADKAIDMGAVLRKQFGGQLQPGLTPRQVGWLSKIWFAPQFTSGLAASFADPVIARGPAQREAIRTFASAFGGAASLVLAANMAMRGTPG